MFRNAANGARLTPPHAYWQLLGRSLVFFGAVLIAPFLVALARADVLGASSFAAAAVLSVLAGFPLSRAQRFENHPHDTRTLLSTVALIWLCCSILAAVPFALQGRLAPLGVEVSGAYPSWWHAWFESMSGLTSTGLTMSSAPSQLPSATQLWRSLMQWVGGFSIVAFIGLVRGFGKRQSRHMTTEIDVSFEGSQADERTLCQYVSIYAAYTAAVIASFAAAGMPAWQALNHGLTAVATGGFTVTDDSFASYGAAIRTIAVVATIVSALSWQWHHLVWFRRDLRAAIRSTQARFLAACLIGGAVAFALIVPRRSDIGAGEAVFEWVSALGTAGFSVTPSHAAWPAFGLLLLVAAMGVGGASGSTTGGLKQERFAWLVKGAWRRLRRPTDFTSASYVEDGQPAEDAAGSIVEAATLALLYVVVLGGVCVALSVATPDAEGVRIAFDVASALGNVGLGAGFIGGDQSAWILAVFTAVMLLGRLEIVAVVVLVSARRATDPSRPGRLR